MYQRAARGAPSGHGGRQHTHLGPDLAEGRGPRGGRTRDRGTWLRPLAVVRGYVAQSVGLPDFRGRPSDASVDPAAELERQRQAVQALQEGSQQSYDAAQNTAGSLTP